MKKTLIIGIILGLLFITGCVDNISSVQHCESLGLQYTGKIFGCDIECINTTTGQKFIYDGECKLVRR